MENNSVKVCFLICFAKLCKFHCCKWCVALVPQCITAWIREKRDSFGSKQTFATFDFWRSEMIDSQFWRHKPLGTPFRHIYLGVIRAKNDDLLAAGAVFCVRLHAPTVNCFRFRPGVELAVRAVITFESAYFFFIHSRISPLILPKEAVAAKRRHGYYQIIL